MSYNAQALIRAGFIDKLMAGVYTIVPLGLRVINKIENIVREEINAIDGQEIFMPSLQPKENWTKTGRWEHMDDYIKLRMRVKESLRSVQPMKKLSCLWLKSLPNLIKTFRSRLTSSRINFAWNCAPSLAFCADANL